MGPLQCSSFASLFGVYVVPFLFARLIYEFSLIVVFIIIFEFVGLVFKFQLRS